MKNFVLLLALFLGISGCSTQKVTFESVRGKQQKEPLPDGEMVKFTRIDLYKDTIYAIKTDGAGKIYPVLTPQKDTALIRLQVAYDLKIPMPDSRQGYELYIPLPNPVKLSKKKAYEVPVQKVLFGYQAFHPQAGYRTLDKGEIKLWLKDKHTVILEVKLEDKVASKINGTYTITLKEDEK